jgi:tetratricopeptide (TPR) repeat protein
VALAKLAEQEGRREEALAAYQSALVLEPRQLTSLYRGGVLLLELGRPEQAQELLSRAAERAPNNRLVQLRLERARTELESRAAAGRE